MGSCLDTAGPCSSKRRESTKRPPEECRGRKTSFDGVVLIELNPLQHSRRTLSPSRGTLDPITATFLTIPLALPRVLLLRSKHDQHAVQPCRGVKSKASQEYRRKRRLNWTGTPHELAQSWGCGCFSGVLYR